MGTDWERMQGQGGAYLGARGAGVLKSGRLSPMAVALVEAEVERVKFILDEEIARLEPAGDLTPAAIAALRTQYQARLDAAVNVIAAARGPVEKTPTPALHQTAPTLLSPASGGGKDACPEKDARPAIGGGKGAPQRSLREFFADRSILIPPYVGPFLLIRAPRLFH